MVQSAIPYSELDRIKEAKVEAQQILKLVPNFSVGIYGGRMPYKDPAKAERDMAALRKAAVAELIPGGTHFQIEGKDHLSVVPDLKFKMVVRAFLNEANRG